MNNDFINTISVVVNDVNVDYGYDSKTKTFFVFYGPFSISGIGTSYELYEYLKEMGLYD